MPGDIIVGENMKRPVRSGTPYTLLLAAAVVLIASGIFFEVTHSKLEQLELQLDSLSLKIQQQHDALRSLQPAVDGLGIKETPLRLESSSRGRLTVTPGVTVLESSSHGRLTVTPDVTVNALMSTLLEAGMTASNAVINCPTNPDGTFAHGAPCIIEFDVVYPFNMMTINFVFGSEKHPRLVNRNSNDAFGLFISGPGPACQPGFYNNTNVAILADNDTLIQYNAFSTVLNRKIALCPCQTYHLKLVIAEPNDCNDEPCAFIDFISSTMTLNATPIPSPSNSDDCTGSVIVKMTGQGPFTYNWAPAPGVGQGTNTPSQMCPGTYTVSIHDAIPCSPSATFVVTIPMSAR